MVASTVIHDAVPLSLPSNVGPPDIDQAILRAVGRSKKKRKFLLDLQAVAHLQPAALIYLIASIASLERRGILDDLQVEMPESRTARDFLRRWRFGSALSFAVRADPGSLLTKRSADYRAADSRSPSQYRPAQTLGQDGHLVDLTSGKYFTTRYHDLRAEATPSQFAQRQGERWDDTDIRAVLDRHLGRKANLLAPGVIYEAILNAAYHPKAESLVVLSHLDVNATKKYPNGLLTISLWDDGTSITETLRGPLTSGDPLRVDSFDHYYDWYALYRARPGTPDDWRHSATMFSGDLDDKNLADDAIALLTATFPGVSSAHDRPPSSVQAQGLGHGWEKTGMGLYILTSIVIDSFGGEVALRGGRGFASIKRASEFDQQELRCRYRCNTFVLSDRYLPFVGNQVTVRIPLIGTD